MAEVKSPDLILTNGRFTTLDRRQPEVAAVAIASGRFTAVGAEELIVPTAGPRTRVIDCGGRRVIPGLIDNHIHIIRGGLNYNMELRWDGVPSLADAMRNAQGAGGAHAGAAMGARGRRLHRAPVRREAPADPRRDQRRGARHAGVHPASLRPRAAQRRRAARGRLHQGHARPARRRDRARRATATRPACCSPRRTPASSTRRSARARSCRSSTRSTRPATSCASSTGWA